MINSKNFLTIQGWMISELGLSGNELLVYAIIYNFSQTTGQKCTASLQYFADWCNCEKRTIQNVLKSLQEKKLISKKTLIKNKIKCCEYDAFTQPKEQKITKKAYQVEVVDNDDEFYDTDGDIIEQLIAQNAQKITEKVKEIKELHNEEKYEIAVKENLNKKFENQGEFETFCKSPKTMSYDAKVNSELIVEMLKKIYPNKSQDGWKDDEGRTLIGQINADDIRKELNENPNWQWITGSNLFLIIKIKDGEYNDYVGEVIVRRRKNKLKTILAYEN